MNKVRKIITDEKVLRLKSSPIMPEDNLVEIIKSLQDSLSYYGGVGLAAIQIGSPKRVFIFKSDPMKDEAMVLINPVMKDQYDEMVCSGEGCLSIPGKRINTKRFKYIRVEVMTDGEPKQYTFSGQSAQIVQHEMDHLDGIIMTDREYIVTHIGRNDPCTCGSGKKFKKCCLNKE